MVFSHRFTDKLEECIHVLIAVLIADIYHAQVLELIDNYGDDVVEEAYMTIQRDYSQILKRLK